MNILVLIKQTFDTEAKIVIDSNGKISKQGVTLVMNPYDEYAVEEALRIKEKSGGEVTVISAGAPEAQDALRQALAMGADRAVLVTDPCLEEGDEFTAAAVLAKVVEGLPYDLVLAGWRAIDDNSAQVALRVAEIIGVPHANVVTKIEVEGDKATVTREIEGGTEILQLPLPALFTAQKGLNEPRYPSMKGIMQAKKKPMQKISLADLGLEAGQVAPRVKALSYSLPSPRAAGKVITGEAPEAARELARLLREEAKII